MGVELAPSVTCRPSVDMARAATVVGSLQHERGLAAGMPGAVPRLAREGHTRSGASRYRERPSSAEVRCSGEVPYAETFVLRRRVGMAAGPWSKSIAELLGHGLGHLLIESDLDRVVAFLSIDNAVELMLKTYLGLPNRITGLLVSRKELTEAENSFPQLVDLAERHLHAKTSIDWGQVEWFHRLRNQLYHEANGFTVSRSQANEYGELARQLLQDLFHVEPAPPAPQPSPQYRYLAWCIRCLTYCIEAEVTGLPSPLDIGVFADERLVTRDDERIVAQFVGEYSVLGVDDAAPLLNEMVLLQLERYLDWYQAADLTALP